MGSKKPLSQNLNRSLTAARQCSTVRRSRAILTRGVNILALWAAGDAKGYESGTWGTYKAGTNEMTFYYP